MEAKDWEYFLDTSLQNASGREFHAAYDELIHLKGKTSLINVFDNWLHTPAVAQSIKAHIISVLRNPENLFYTAQITGLLNEYFPQASVPRATLMAGVHLDADNWLETMCHNTVDYLYCGISESMYSFYPLKPSQLLARLISQAILLWQDYVDAYHNMYELAPAIIDKSVDFYTNWRFIHYAN